MLKWPEPALVERSLRRWARGERKRHPQLLRLGYFGSYARADAGVGSDLDLVAIVSESRMPFERRAVEWDLGSLPVPAEILVYTEQEWHELSARSERFARMLKEETVWI